MLKKCFSIALALMLLLGLLPCSVSAANEVENTDVIRFEDGSYIRITIEASSARATNTKNGYKKYVYYDSDDNVEWEAKLSASFTYTGSTSTCTSASCTVTVYDSKWYEVSKSTTRSGNTATTQLTMGRKFLGITVDKPEYTIKLTCDKNGNLS